MILNDLGWRLELRTETGLPGLGRLVALAYQRKSREGDWMVSTRSEPAPRSVRDKDAARVMLVALKAELEAAGSFLLSLKSLSL